MMQEDNSNPLFKGGVLAQWSHYFTKYILLDYHFIQLGTS